MVIAVMAGLLALFAGQANAVDQDPKSADKWQALGIALADRGEYTEAVRAFTRLVELRPMEGDGLALLGLAEFHLRRFDDALLHIERGRRLPFRTPRLQVLADYHSALMMISRSDFDAAQKRLLKLAALGADSENVAEALGFSALRLAVLPDEASAEDRVAARDTGRILLKSAREPPEKAIADWTALIGRFPRLRGVHYAFGMYLLSLGQSAEAVPQFEAELRLNDRDALAHVQIAAAKLLVSDSETALAAADRAIALAPNLFAGYLLKGRALLDMDRDAEAIPALEKAAALAPQSQRIWGTLQVAYARAGRMADAARAANEASRLQSIETEMMRGAR